MILPHYADDVVFRSPVAARVRPEQRRRHRRQGGARRLLGAPRWPRCRTCTSPSRRCSPRVDALTIVYRNQLGGQVAETLVLGPDGLVTYGQGAYA